jgi:hypothetical protein
MVEIHRVLMCRYDPLKRLPLCFTELSLFTRPGKRRFYN